MNVNQINLQSNSSQNFNAFLEEKEELATAVRIYHTILTNPQKQGESQSLQKAEARLKSAIKQAKPLLAETIRGDADSFGEKHRAIA